METKTDEMFGVDELVQTNLGELAEEICLLKAKVDRIKKEVTAKTEVLIEKMLQSGTASLSTPNGLKPKIETKCSLTAIADQREKLLDWLKTNNLGAIIKTEPHVESSTLKSTLLIYKEQGNDLPDELVNYFEYQDIRWNGKSKFLAERIVAA